MGDVEFGWTRGSAPLPALGTAGVDDRRSSLALSRRERRLSGIVTAVVEVTHKSQGMILFFEGNWRVRQRQTGGVALLSETGLGGLTRAPSV